jgi:hypothetical protein
VEGQEGPTRTAVFESAVPESTLFRRSALYGFCVWASDFGLWSVVFLGYVGLRKAPRAVSRMRAG